MLDNKLWLVAALVITSSACWMGPVSDGAVTSSLSTSEAQCQMTVQTDSFAGLCAQIEISNTGVETMQGWQLAFDLPTSSHLQNSWNGNFVITGQHVVVTPLATNGNLAIAASITLGYCATETGANIAATPGECDGDQGTAVTQDSNADVSASEVQGAENADGT